MGDTITLVTVEDLRASGDRFWKTDDLAIKHIMRYGQMVAVQQLLRSLRHDTACLLRTCTYYLVVVSRSLFDRLDQGSRYTHTRRRAISSSSIDYSLSSRAFRA